MPAVPAINSNLPHVVLSLGNDYTNYVQNKVCHRPEPIPNVQKKLFCSKCKEIEPDGVSMCASAYMYAAIFLSTAVAVVVTASVDSVPVRSYAPLSALSLSLARALSPLLSLSHTHLYTHYAKIQMIWSESGFKNTKAVGVNL